jgi:hypothetical protein
MKGVLGNEDALPLGEGKCPLEGSAAGASSIGPGASFRREILPSTDGAVFSRNRLLYAE